MRPRTIPRRLRLVDPVDYPRGVRRPGSRPECEGFPRPCPFVSCRYHLFLDVNPESGSVKLNFPELEPDELVDTCALDVADRGDATLEEVGERMNVTRERARQIEAKALAKMGAHPVIRELARDFGGAELPPLLRAALQEAERPAVASSQTRLVDEDGEVIPPAAPDWGAA